MHTPPVRCFELFTHLVLLTSDGEMAYYGPSSKLLTYFESLGASCPEHFNVADFALEQVSTKTINWEDVTSTWVVLTA